jgi:hypothetical protein
MTIPVKKAETLEEGIQNIIEAAKEDYEEWSGGRLDTDKYSVEEGRSYIKIIRDNSVHSFVVKKETVRNNKVFKVGDILKPASWKAPAMNVARGNIFEEGSPMNWTGPLYL